MKQIKRMLSIFLAVCLLAGLLTPAAFAEENTDTTEAVSESWNLVSDKWSDSSIMPDSSVAAVNADSANSGWSYIGAKVSENRMRRYRNPAQIRVASDSQGSWVAVEINAPAAGAGIYTLSMVHGVSSDYGASKANVYVLPGSVADAVDEVANPENIAAVEAAVAGTQKVGSINFDQGETDPTAKVRVDSKIGTFDFTGEDSYIIVFWADSPNDHRTTGYYMYLGEFTLTQGNTMGETGGDTGDDNTGDDNTGGDNTGDDNTGGDNTGGGTPEDPGVSSPAVDVDVMEYDFFYAGVDSSTEQLMTSKKYGKPALDKEFAAGTMNWTPVVETAGTLANSYSRYSDSWSGVQIRASVGEWAAIKIKSPGTGTYNVVLQYFNNTGSARQAEVYILPLSVGENVTPIENAIADDTYKLKTVVNFRSGATPLPLGYWDFVSGEDCLVVFKAIADKGNRTEVTIEESTGLPYTAYMGLQKLTLVKKTYETGVYNFVQSTYTGKNVSDITASGATVLSELYEKYGTYSLNWQIEDMTATSATFTASGLTVESGEGGWIAYRVMLPAAGTYLFKLDYSKASKGAKIARVYLVEAADGMTQNDIWAELNSDNLLGKISFNGSGSASVEIGTGLDLKSTEYLVVFEVYQGSADGAQMQFGKLSVSAKNMVEYNFALGDRNNGINGYNGLQLDSTLKDGTAVVVDDIASRYDAGTLNWCYYDAYNTRSGMENPLTGVDFRSTGGMRIRADMDTWYAFTIKSPGSGTYTLSLDYAVYSYGTAECAIYIIEKPAAGTDLAALVNKMVLDEDPFATVNMYGTELQDGYRSVLGTYEFKADKEYVVIYYALAPYSGANKGAAYMFISHLIAVEGVIEAEATKSVVALNLGDPIWEVSMRGKIGLAEIDGMDYYYLPIEGGGLLVYNLDTMEKVTEVKSGIENAWSCNVDSEGTCYVAGDAKYVFKYNVVTGLNEKLYFTDVYCCAYDLEVAENGDFYFGYRGADLSGCVVKYDVSEGKFIYYAGPDGKGLDPKGIADTCTAVAYNDGYIYCNYSGTDVDDAGNVDLVTDIVKIDEATGEVVARVDITKYTINRDPELYYSQIFLDALGVAGDLLIGGGTYLNYFICLDINTMEYVDLGLIFGNSNEISEIKDGKVYCTLYQGAVVEIDIENRTGTYVQGMTSAAVGFRCTNNSFVTFNHPDLPGESLFTCSTSSLGGPVIYNLQTKATVTYPEWTKGEGSGHAVKCVYASNDGSGMIFVGGYTTDLAAAYDLYGDRWAYEFLTTGQTDSLYMYEGKLYCGGYSSCTLGVVDYTTGYLESLLCLSKDPTNYHQKRIHCITGGDGNIFFSTVPDTGALGGCLVVFDIENYDYLVLEDFVHNQIILNMFYKDGLLFGSTSVSGGTDSSPLEKVAKIFVYDVKNNVKLGEFVVDIEGVSKEDVPFISGLSIDENGKMWGVVAETLFSFTYDKKSNTMAFTEELSFSKTTFAETGSRDWFGAPIIFHEGYIYFSFRDAKLRKINMADPSDNEIITSYSPILYAIGEDGNLYYGNGNSLMMLPLVYDDSDWDAAAKVDAQISALETKVTVSNAHKVLSVLEAYDNLTDEQKCLVQNYSRLTTLHRRLVVVLINALPSEITLDDLAQVEEVRALYDALSPVTSRFVTNLEILENAESAIRNLKYLAKSEEAAALVMKHIENIPAEITMAAAGKINVARTAYEALTDYQKSLVTNYQKLLDAEAAMQVLVTAQNQTYADKVIAQIDALGTITLRSQKAIMMARLAYGALTEEQKVLVTNYQKLLDAEAELENLQKNGDPNIKAVEAVEALIKLIGDEISLDSGDAIKAARDAYDALTDFQKTLVNNIDDLVEAENIYNEIKAEQDKMIAMIVTVVIVAVVVVAGVTTLFVVPASRKKILGLFKKKSQTEAE